MNHVDFPPTIPAHCLQVAPTPHPPLNMSNPATSRLDNELQLLEAMYPGQIHYDPAARQLKFAAGLSSTLHLRLPARYPDAGGLPDVIGAHGAHQTDLRSQTREAIRGLALSEGEEVLDAVIAVFEELVCAQAASQEVAPLETRRQQQQKEPTQGSRPGQDTAPSRTVVIWLHHLLNTHKRKLALSPPPSTPPVSGITKPGYPGILLYTGPSAAVSEHVHALRAQNWQAFQVRYEADAAWTLAHGQGVREVERMSDVVKAVEEEGTVEQKMEFLKAVGIK